MEKFTIVIQASSTSWSGGQDDCLKILNGKTILENTIDKVINDFDTQIKKIWIIAPEFDSGRLDKIVNKYKSNIDVDLFCGFNGSPLMRMKHIANDLKDYEVILRLNGLNFCLDSDAAKANLQKAQTQHIDCIKFPDNFPALFTSDVYRVGALRRIANIENLDSKWHIHPKYFMEFDKDYVVSEYLPIIKKYTDKLLLDVREKCIESMNEKRVPVVKSKSIKSGDTIVHHYQMSLNYLNKKMKVLDLACGDGFGAQIISNHVQEIFALDNDAEIINNALAKNKFINLKYTTGDALNMPFDDNVFDAILAFEIIEHLDPDKLLSEIYRTLKSNSVLILSTPQNLLGHIPLTADHSFEFSLSNLKGKISKFFSIEEFIGIKQGTISFQDVEIGANSFVVARKI